MAHPRERTSSGALHVTSHCWALKNSRHASSIVATAAQTESILDANSAVIVCQIGLASRTASPWYQLTWSRSTAGLPALIAMSACIQSSSPEPEDVVLPTKHNNLGHLELLLDAVTRLSSQIAWGSSAHEQSQWKTRLCCYWRAPGRWPKLSNGHVAYTRFELEFSVNT